MFVTTIESFEKSNVSLVDSTNLIENTIVKLRRKPGENGDKIKLRIDQVQKTKIKGSSI